MWPPLQSIEKKPNKPLCQFNENIFFIVILYHSSVAKRKRKGAGVFNIYTGDKHIHQSKKAIVRGPVKKECCGGLLVVGMKQSLHSM